MTDMTWHVSVEALADYAEGKLPDVAAMSVEAHVGGCAACRLAVVPYVGASRLSAIWHRVLDDVVAPQPGRGERMLRRLGVRAPIARLVVATPALRWSWLLSLSAALGFGIVAARAGHSGEVVLLVMAPLVPLAGVGLSYGAGSDPLHELALAAPVSGGRLLLLRSVAVLGVTIPLVATAALLGAGVSWTAVAWLLPSLALALGALALGTVVSLRRAASLLGGTWVLAAVGAQASVEGDLVALGLPGQVGSLLVAVAAITILILQRRELEYGATL